MKNILSWKAYPYEYLALSKQGKIVLAGDTEGYWRIDGIHGAPSNFPYKYGWSMTFVISNEVNAGMEIIKSTEIFVNDKGQLIFANYCAPTHRSPSITHCYLLDGIREWYKGETHCQGDDYTWTDIIGSYYHLNGCIYVPQSLE